MKKVVFEETFPTNQILRFNFLDKTAKKIVVQKSAFAGHI